MLRQHRLPKSSHNTLDTKSLNPQRLNKNVGFDSYPTSPSPLRPNKNYCYFHYYFYYDYYSCHDYYNYPYYYYYYYYSSLPLPATLSLQTPPC